MKKRVAIMLTLILTVLLAIPVLAGDTVKVIVDGKQLDFEVPPTIIAGRTLVPMREIFEALGAKVEWIKETQTVIAKKDKKMICLTIGNKYATVNGWKKDLEVPCTIVDNRTMIPIRFIGESLGAKVDWDAATKTINIVSPVNKITETNQLVDSELSVHFIDVGQGEAIFVDYGEYDILIDCGNEKSGKKVVDYLKSNNVDDIELFVATLPDSDHMNGARAIVDNFKIERIIDSGVFFGNKIYENYSKILNEEEDAEYYFNEASILIDWGFGDYLPKDVKLEEDGIIISVNKDITLRTYKLGHNEELQKLNNESVVTLLQYKDIKFLFTGDIESDIERLNLDKFNDIDILKVANHGSNVSTSIEFLDKVKPEVAVISAGLGNEFGYPHSETLALLEKLGNKIYGTYKHGNIVISTDGNSYDIETEN